MPLLGRMLSGSSGSVNSGMLFSSPAMPPAGTQGVSPPVLLSREMSKAHSALLGSSDTCPEGDAPTHLPVKVPEATELRGGSSKRRGNAYNAPVWRWRAVPNGAQQAFQRMGAASGEAAMQPCSLTLQPVKLLCAVHDPPQRWKCTLQADVSARKGKLHAFGIGL